MCAPAPPPRTSAELSTKTPRLDEEVDFSIPLTPPTPDVRHTRAKR